MFLVNSFRTTCLSVVLLGAAAGSLAAQSPAKQPWENTVTLYGWGAAMSGTQGIGPLTATVDIPFSEILDHLKMGAMLNYMGRGQTWVTGADFIYMKLGQDATTPGGTTVAEVKLKQWLFEVDGGYRVLPWMDALIGVRVPVIEAEVVPDVNFPNASEKSASETWFAPLIGVRVFLPVTKHLTVIGRGDLGGFQIGGTNTTWQAAGYLNYKFGRHFSTELGYRALNADYATGTPGQPGYFLYDITNYGGLLGLSYTF
jgi:hypothetical protein